MEATLEVTMDFHMDMDIMPTADVLTAMAGPMVLTTALDLMFMANRNFKKEIKNQKAIHFWPKF